MRLFPLLLLIIVLGEIAGYYLAVKYHNNRWFYNLFTPIQYLLYFIIFYYAISKNQFRTIILVSIFLYMLLSVFTYDTETTLNISVYLSGAVLLIVFIIGKLYELIDSSEEMDFLKAPFFYISFATLIFNVAGLPFFVMNNWMTNTKAAAFISIFNNVLDTLNIVLYGTYTIAFIWIRKTGSYL